MVETPRSLALVPAVASVATTPVDFESLFRGYARYVAGVALKLLGRDGEVDDVVQEVFLRAVKGLKRDDNHDALKGWLATVTVRVASRKLKQRRLARWLQLDQAPGYLEVAAATAGAEDRLLLGRVFAALDELRVSQRVAWSLRHLEGEPLDEVARLCGCSLATAKRRIARAQAFLTEHFVSPLREVGP